MAIRIECGTEGFETCWVEFREKPWPFGDRRAMLEGQSDLISLEIIFEYIEKWSMLDIEGKIIKFDQEAGLEILDNMDELLVNWIIGAWFEARAARGELSKKVLEN